MSSKADIINTINEMHKIPLNDLKKDPVGNASGTNHKALMQYNAMLDNITIGAGTSTKIELAGYEWQLRLLTADEYVNMRLDTIQVAKEKECFDEWYLYYLEAIKTLAIALTPSPFKTEGKTIFTEEDLKMVNLDILLELYKRYIYFVQMATKTAEEFTEEEAQALIEIVKKKPEVLNELNRKQSLLLNRYLLNYSQNLEKMLKSESIN